MCADPNNRSNDSSCWAQKCARPKKILLECGCHPQDAIFEICNGNVKENQCFILDHVNVDTTCLYRPIVKIEFSSLVCFKAEDDCGLKHEIEVDLQFALIRTCKGVSECIQSWKYLKDFELKNSLEKLEIEISEPFTVTFCDNPCPGCCEYKMIVKGKDFDGKFDTLRVVTPNLSALAQGLCGD